jgi:hypothetical protein
VKRSPLVLIVVAFVVTVPRHHSKRTADGAHSNSIAVVQTWAFTRVLTSYPMYFVARDPMGRTRSPLHFNEASCRHPSLRQRGRNGGAGLRVVAA